MNNVTKNLLAKLIYELNLSYHRIVDVGILTNILECKIWFIVQNPIDRLVISHKIFKIISDLTHLNIEILMKESQNQYIFILRFEKDFYKDFEVIKLQKLLCEIRESFENDSFIMSSEAVELYELGMI